MALAISGLSVWYARRQTRASERQAEAAAETLQLQAEVLKTQAEDTRRALDIADRSAQSSERSATAAEELAEANERLSIASERAWLVVSSFGLTEIAHSKEQTVYTAKLSIKNAGKTPAVDVTARICCSVLDSVPEGFASGYDAQYGTINPGEQVVFAQSVSCEPEVYARVKKRGATAWFYGNARYKDVFGYGRTTYWRLHHDYRNTENGVMDVLTVAVGGNSLE